MKKIYIQPQTATMTVKATQMICVSFDFDNIEDDQPDPYEDEPIVVD